jgi:hypothetical protein
MTEQSNRIVTLSNNKRVANFSSPHPFTFEDGTILPAVSAEESERLSVRFTEEHINTLGDIKLSFSLTRDVINEMILWEKLALNNEVDTVFCPLPMITAMYAAGYEVLFTPFRSIRMTDRVSKLASITKQCL